MSDKITRTGITPRDRRSKTKVSGKILQEMEVLAREYKRLIKEEIKDLENDHLLNLATHNGATWSGGHSIKNFGEQVIQEATLDLINHRRY